LWRSLTQRARPSRLPLDTSRDDVRADVKVCRLARRTPGRGVQVMGDQMDFLVGTGSCETSDLRIRIEIPKRNGLGGLFVPAEQE
jgi:hypothetical protein